MDTKKNVNKAVFADLLRRGSKPHWSGFIDLGGPRFKGSKDKGNSQEKWSIDSTASVGSA